MLKIRNALICFGIFWFSLWFVAPVGWFFSKLNEGITYDESVISAIGMGVMMSSGRAFAAAFAGAFVTCVADGKRTERWAFVIATLYIVAAPVRHHWSFPATSWDRLWQGIDLVFPALVCVASAFVTPRLRLGKTTA
jgi:hypothetical protein